MRKNYLRTLNNGLSVRNNSLIKGNNYVDLGTLNYRDVATNNSGGLDGSTNITNSSVDNKGKLLKGIGETATTLLNKFHQPDIVRQGNNATGDLVSKGLDIIYYLDRVTNIEEIGKIYETIGYKVDRVVNGSPINNNRQLYNYVECSNIELEIDMLSSDNIINDLHGRFINGLRLWNIQTMNTNNLSLGDVCVYDNVETQEEVTNE